jgi:mannitol/fructose-specific phosphotransferase system IIA component (Ntr-type)
VSIALGRSHAGIPFASSDGKPVHLLFVIASPSGASLEYLQALSCLVRAVRRTDVRQSLLDSADPPEIERRIREAFRGSLQRVSAPRAE